MIGAIHPQKPVEIGTSEPEKRFEITVIQVQNQLSDLAPDPFDILHFYDVADRFTFHRGIEEHLVRFSKTILLACLGIVLVPGFFHAVCKIAVISRLAPEHFAALRNQGEAGYFLTQPFVIV